MHSPPSLRSRVSSPFLSETGDPKSLLTQMCRRHSTSIREAVLRVVLVLWFRVRAMRLYLCLPYACRFVSLEFLPMYTFTDLSLVAEQIYSRANRI
jgi:hypothetical protein